MTKIEDFFFELFRESNCKAGNILPMRNVRHRLRERLNPKEEEQLKEVLQRQIEEGYYTYESGPLGECLKLTQKLDTSYLREPSSLELEGNSTRKRRYYLMRY